MSKKLSLEVKLIFLAGAMIAGSSAYRLTELSDKSRADVKIMTAAVTETTANAAVSGSERENAKVTERPTEPPFLLLDINSATADELIQLSGIGEHLAAEIVAYREEHGRFLNVEELTKVSGIGEATLADIRGHVYVTDPVYTTEVQAEKPSKPHTEPPETVEETEPPLTLEDAAPIDLNTADAELLALLPHVNDEEAAEIIELREKLGRFSSYYELLYISSLSEKDVSDIMEYVTLE